MLLQQKKTYELRMNTNQIPSQHVAIDIEKPPEYTQHVAGGNERPPQYAQHVAVEMGQPPEYVTVKEEKGYVKRIHFKRKQSFIFCF